MMHKLSFVAIAAVFGSFLGGIVWLVLYMMNIGLPVDFQVPALYPMLLFMLSGWLIVSVVAIVLYARHARKCQLIRAISLALLFGLLPIGVASLTLVLATT